MKFCFILGTRPEVIKLFSLIKVAQKSKIDFFILHTNQHYDEKMDRVFFKELGLPKPKYNLNVGSGSHGKITGAMIGGIEPILMRERPTHVFVQGDTNTVLAGSIAASKLPFITLCHVEAGLRSFDREMPEEINRIVADHASDYLFCPTRASAKLAISEHIESKKVFVVGNTVVDAVKTISRLESKILQKLSVKKNGYLLLTAHRPSNVDNLSNFSAIVHAVEDICSAHNLQCIFPVHPRTKKMMEAFKIKLSAFIATTEPLGYVDLINLEKSAYMILTDSGGIQEEACILKKKCIVLRTNTERPETLTVGGSLLLSKITSEEIISKFNLLNNKRVTWRNPFGGGKSAQKIVSMLMRGLHK